MMNNRYEGSSIAYDVEIRKNVMIPMRMVFNSPLTSISPRFMVRPHRASFQ